MQKITEQDSPYRHLESMPVQDLLENMNHEDSTVPAVIRKIIPEIARLVNEISDRMLAGGRLFYIGAGTSGRLGILDASECPPTFGVPQGLVIGIIAGGDSAIRKAVEHAEDDPEGGWNDLQAFAVSPKDVVIGIAASGTTPYVVGALQHCRKEGIFTACITCNPGTPLAAVADIPLEVITGPECITGSTRLKAGTAQKLCLNMISTAVMVQLGRVEDNKMVDMQLSNDKLLDRGTRMVSDALGLPYEEARKLLLEKGSVRAATGSMKK